jgi:hypothetical protein
MHHLHHTHHTHRAASQLGDLTLALAVNAHTLPARGAERLATALQRRVHTLRDDGEHGAQAAEYAMLGGVSAAACGGLIHVLRRPETLEAVVGAVVRSLTSVIRGWF